VQADLDRMRLHIEGGDNSPAQDALIAALLRPVAAGVGTYVVEQNYALYP
jgi:hypothetical protein